MTVDELQVLITANTEDLQKEIGNANKSIANLQKGTNKSTSAMGSVLKKFTAGVVALGIGKVIANSITSGMEAIENDSLFDTVLDENANAVRSWSDEVSNTLGVSSVNMQKNIATIYNMTTSMGLAGDTALTMSKGVSALAEDMASFYNLDSSEAFNKLRAGLTGETEPLKALGILVDENTIKQVAYSEGIAQNGAELTNQQKVLARYVAILNQTGNAQGDLARTLNSPSNQLRSLKQSVADLGIAFSKLLMPVISAILPYLNAFTRLITSALNSLAKFFGLSSGGGASKETQAISDNVGGLSDGYDDANKSAKKLKGTLAGFDEMNVLQDNSDSEGSGGAGVGAVGGDMGFDLSEYDIGLESVNNKVNEIVENIKTAFGGVGEFLTNLWSTVWNSEPVQSFVGAVITYGQTLWDYWFSLGSNLFENIVGTWNNISDNVGTALTNTSTFWSLFWQDIQAGMEKWGAPLIESVTRVFDTIYHDAIEPVIEMATQIWADFSGILVELWTEHGEPLIDAIGGFVKSIIDLFQSIWDNTIEPIITPFLEMLSDVWDKHIKGMVETVGDFVMSLIENVLIIWNEFVSPIIMWLLDKLSPAFAKLGTFVAGAIGTVIGLLSDLISAVAKILGGIINFIVGVFTGDWEKAWKGICDFFGGIWDGVIGIFKSIINVVIDVINTIIAGINKMHWTVPDWVPVIGGKEFGFSIPKIPKLARGGVVDSPTYAMIGEAGAEAVVPLERNLGYLDKLAGMLADKIGGGGSDIKLIVKLGEDTIFDKFIEYTKEKSFETNGEVVFV